MCCPNFQVQKENNGNTTRKIPLKCKNVYIINFHIIRKPLHFLHVYHIIKIYHHKLYENNTLFRLQFSIDNV